MSIRFKNFTVHNLIWSSKKHSDIVILWNKSAKAVWFAQDYLQRAKFW